MTFDNLFGNTTAQLTALTAPVKKFNALAVDNLEKLARLQLDTVKSYTDLSLTQLRAALDVSDVQSLQAYVSNQQETAKVVSEKLAKDAAVYGDLAKQFATEVQKLAQEQVQGFSGLAQTKKAA